MALGGAPCEASLVRLRQDLVCRVLSGLWPWEWRLVGNLSPVLLRVVRASDEALLKLLPVEWFQSNSHLRQFIAGAAEQGQRRWILAMLGADMEALESLCLLHAVCRGGHAEAAQMLLRIGADANLRDAGGLCALHLAARRDSADLVLALVEAEAEVNAAAGGRRTRPLDVAVDGGHAAACRALLASRADVEGPGGSALSPMALASRSGAVGTLRLLLDARASAEAAGDAVLPLHEAVRGNRPEAAVALLEARASVNAARVTGSTALHVACRSGHLRAVELLLARQAEVNAVNEGGQTPLGLAFQASQRSRAARASYRALREALVRAGAGLGEFNPTLYRT